MRALFFLLACLLATPAAAERYALAFEGYALNVAPLGGITVDADVSEDSYAVTATLRSSGLLNLFERTNLRAVSSGEVRDGVVFWRSYDLDHHYSQKHRTIAMRVGEDGAVNAAIEPNYRLWGEPPTSDAQRRRSRDPLSSMVAMAIDVAQSRRCSGAYPTFDGRFHYLLELGGGEIDQFDRAGYEGEVLKCSLAYIAVAGFQPRDAGRRRIPHGEVWFALVPGSRFAPPVRISTPLAAGGAVIRLTRFNRAEVDVSETATAP
jgi:hypothetical protein